MPPFDTFEELLSWVRVKRAGGRSRAEIVAFLGRLLPLLDEDTDDLVRDVLDRLTHHCVPEKRID